MAQDTKSRVVNYRRCVADDANGQVAGFNLQDLLVQAEGKVKRPWNRPIGMGGAQAQYLMYLTPKQSCLCGTLVLCESDKLIPLVDAKADGSPWEGTIEPKDAQGIKRKLEEQALFFAVRENHVAIIQTRELSISDLQDFLVWFIQGQAQLVPNCTFNLLNTPAKSALEKLKDNPVRGIKIGGNAFWVEKTQLPKKEGSVRHRIQRTLQTDPVMFSLLKKVTKDSALLNKLEKSKHPGAVHVELKISFRSSSESDAQEIVRGIAANFGGQPNLSPEIKLSGKSRIKDDELTIGGDVNVQCPGGNFSKDDAMARVADWLLDSIISNKIPL